MSLTTSFTFGGMNNVSDPANVGIPDTSLRVQDRAYTQCVDMVNCDVDNDMNAILRKGRQMVAGAVITSAWGDDSKAYCVAGGALHLFDGENLIAVGNSPTLRTSTEFCPVNDMVVFSDNTTIGHICDGVTTVIKAPSEAIDLLDLETWVKLTYPAGAAATESNMEINAFNVTTMAGRCLEFFNGALYLAVDNFIYCTKAFDVEHMDIRYNVVAGFPATVTMIKAVTDGLYIGTEDGCYFLAGAVGAVGSGFTQKKILPFGAIYGSALKAPAAKITALKAEDTAILWLTSDGVYAGTDSGRYVDLTNSQMYMPTGESAAATIRKQGEAWQYVASVGSQAIVVNLNNAAHSRYTNYAFNGLFKLIKKEYGTNLTGIHLLEGSADNGVPIDATFSTPLVDFGAPQLKRCTDVYLHARTSGDLSLALFVDEIEVATEIPFTASLNLEEGVRRFRAKLPRGAKGTNWQFIISNVDGAPFTAFSLKAVPVVSGRSI